MKPIRLLLSVLLAAACAPRTPPPPALTDIRASPTAVASSTPVVIATQAAEPGETSTPAPTLAAPARSSQVDAETTARHRRIFEQVWNTVNAQYVYPDFNGVNWNAVYAEYGARVDLGLSDEEFWGTLAAMIDLLGDDHSSFLTPAEARRQDNQLEGNLTYAGIGIYASAQVDQQQAIVFVVFSGSPAEAAGLRAHDAILAINDQPVVNPDGTDNLDRLRGLPGTRVTLLVKSPGAAPREVSLPRARIDGALRVSGRALVAEPDTRFGYMLIPTLWDASIESSARETLTELMADGPLDGLIIDMRTNGGGTSTNLLALLSIFTHGQRGEFVSRGEVRPLRLSADPIGNSQSVPLVILIGAATESYAEVFSGVLLEAGRARLVGAHSAGNIETVYGYDFEDGSRAWIARETFIPPSGDNWEKVGLAPSVRVDRAWDEFTEADDPYLAAALELLVPAAGASPLR